MTWQAIVESIGARIESNDRLGMFDEVEDMTQAEHASVSLHERIRGSRGRVVMCSVGGNEINGTLVDCGVDWFTLRHRGELQVIAIGKVTTISGLSVASAPPSRYIPTFNSVLRHLIGQQVQINRLTEPIFGELKAVGNDYVVLETIPKISTSGYGLRMNDRDPANEIYLPIAQIMIVSSGVAEY